MGAQYAARARRAGTTVHHERIRPVQCPAEGLRPSERAVKSDNAYEAGADGERGRPSVWPSGGVARPAPNTGPQHARNKNKSKMAERLNARHLVSVA
jgi:hypothetical protein